MDIVSYQLGLIILQLWNECWHFETFYVPCLRVHLLAINNDIAVRSDKNLIGSCIISYLKTLWNLVMKFLSDIYWFTEWLISYGNIAKKTAPFWIYTLPKEIMSFICIMNDYQKAIVKRFVNWSCKWNNSSFDILSYQFSIDSHLSFEFFKTKFLEKYLPLFLNASFTIRH